MTILSKTEIDTSAPEVHSGYDYDTNRKLDTLFHNWTMADAHAESRNYENEQRNKRAAAALELLNGAIDEAAAIKAAQDAQQAIDELADYEATVYDASFYAQ